MLHKFCVLACPAKGGVSCILNLYFISQQIKIRLADWWIVFQVGSATEHALFSKKKMLRLKSEADQIFLFAYKKPRAFLRVFIKNYSKNYFVITQKGLVGVPLPAVEVRTVLKLLKGAPEILLAVHVIEPG